MFSAGDAQDFASLSGLMNDKQDEERHDHKPGEQQRGGNAPEQACRCGGALAWEALVWTRRIRRDATRSIAMRGAAPSGRGLRGNHKGGLRARVSHVRQHCTLTYNI